MTYEERQAIIVQLTGGDAAKADLLYRLVEDTHWNAMQEAADACARAWAYDPVAKPFPRERLPRPCTSCHFHDTLLRRGL